MENGAPLLPRGMIMMWSGSVATVPAGWLLCDGTNGTPDLRNRFIVGAGTGVDPSLYTPGATGGANTVQLTVAQLPPHAHGIDIGTRQAYAFQSGGLDAMFSTPNQAFSVTENTGSNQPHENRPPYYALCYIMKS